MPEDRISPAQTGCILRQSEVVVVLNTKHVRNADDLVTTMWEVYQVGLVAECTFRLDLGIIKEAMPELKRRRQECSTDSPFVLGVGSIINPRELDAAIDLGFDMIVAPGNVMGGHGEGKDFVKQCRDADVFCAPAVFTPTEFQYFVERSDGLEPDAIKIFPADSHGPSGIKALLAPFVRDHHKNRIIMPTGGVNGKTGYDYKRAILAGGFTPVLGMSAPLELVEKTGKTGDSAVIRDSLAHFMQSDHRGCEER